MVETYTGYALTNSSNQVAAANNPFSIVGYKQFTTAELSDYGLLEQCVICVNKIKLQMAAHGADATIHKVADASLNVAAPFASDLASAITLYKALRDAYVPHNAEIEWHSSDNSPVMNNCYWTYSAYTGPTGGEYILTIDALGTTAYVGAGPNNLTVSGQAEVKGTYEVEIVSGDPTNPNTFRWRKDGGGWNGPTNIPAWTIPLAAGEVEVTWSSQTGHTAGDKWTFLSSDTFTWTVNGAGGEVGRGINLLNDVLEFGLETNFGTARGHSIGDQWIIHFNDPTAMTYHNGNRRGSYAHTLASMADPTDLPTLVALLDTDMMPNFDLPVAYGGAYYGHDMENYAHMNLGTSAYVIDSYRYLVVNSARAIKLPMPGQTYSNTDANAGILNRVYDGGLGDGTRPEAIFPALDSVILRFYYTAPNSNCIYNYLVKKS